jgi:hypothetical protein
MNIPVAYKVFLITLELFVPKHYYAIKHSYS